MEMFDRREIYTELFEFCRCWHGDLSGTQLRTRWTCDVIRLKGFFSDHNHLRRRGIRDVEVERAS
jgi:hypothetical protein